MGRPEIFGLVVDSQTRCRHYHQLIDVIAIKHACCERYYPCHLCHEETAGHSAQLWPAIRNQEPSVLCGVCGHEMTAPEYLAASSCPRCQALFNPGCKAHRHLYFEE